MTKTLQRRDSHVDLAVEKYAGPVLSWRLALVESVCNAELHLRRNGLMGSAGCGRASAKIVHGALSNRDTHCEASTPVHSNSIVFGCSISSTKSFTWS